MADDVTLRECPRCHDGNAEVAYRDFFVSPPRAREYSVLCTACGLRTRQHLSKRAAIHDWNARVPDPRIAALEAEVAALQERRCETCIHGEPTVRRGYKTIYCPRHDTYVWDGCDFGCIYWQGEET